MVPMYGLLLKWEPSRQRRRCLQLHTNICVHTWSRKSKIENGAKGERDLVRLQNTHFLVDNEKHLTVQSHHAT